MTERWEYMSIDWENIRDVSHDSATFYIHRPGAKSETKPGYTSRDPKAKHVGYLDLLQELGAEGWELTAETVLAAATLQTMGWREVQSPVHVRWTLKRRASPDH